MTKQKLKILVIHGPNLNILGQREKNVYGQVTLKKIDSLLKTTAKGLGVSLQTLQSNEEGKIVEAIQKAKKQFDGLLINPAAYTHTSVAIHDALLGVNMPTVEVHLSNIYKREPFRHHSYVAPVALGQISGFGSESYVMGLTALVNHLRCRDDK